LPLDTSEGKDPGYLPEGLQSLSVGASSDRTIAGGDIRVFRVRVREQGVEEINSLAIPRTPHGRILSLRGEDSIENAILSRPTFFQHYDGVMVDWRYLVDRERARLEVESRWLRLQKVRVIVDLSSGLNLYPDLRLIDNDSEAYKADVAAVDGLLAKMSLIGSTDLIVSLHRFPENNMTEKDAENALEAGVLSLCRRSADRGITVYLRTGLQPPRNISDAVAFVHRIGAGNLRIAASTAFLIANSVRPGQAVRDLQGLLGLWLAATPRNDLAGTLVGTNSPIAGDPRVSRFLEAARVAVVFDAIYANEDEEYFDIRALEQSH
jgi:hypothetical protein